MYKGFQSISDILIPPDNYAKRKIKLHSFVNYPVSLRPESKKSKALCAKLRMDDGAMVTLPVSFSSPEDFAKRGPAEWKKRLQMFVKSGRPVPAGAYLDQKPDEFYIEFELDFAFKLMLHNMRLVSKPSLDELALRPVVSSIESAAGQTDFNVAVDFNRICQLFELIDAPLLVCCDVDPDDGTHMSMLPFIKFPAYLTEQDGRISSARVLFDPTWRFGEDGLDLNDAEAYNANRGIIEVQADFPEPVDNEGAAAALKEVLIERVQADMHNGLPILDSRTELDLQEKPDLYIELEPEFGLKCMLHNRLVQKGKTVAQLAELLQLSKESTTRLLEPGESCDFRDYWRAFNAIDSKLKISGKDSDDVMLGR